MELVRAHTASSRMQVRKKDRLKFSESLSEASFLRSMRTMMMSKCERVVSSSSKLGNERYLENEICAPADRVEDQNQVKKRKIGVARRFDTAGLPDSKQLAPIDRLHIKVEADMTL